jgi:dihydroorotate dehydrogenase electron transfer subunit
MIRKIGTVNFNREIAKNFFEAEIISPEISKLCKPGQFINILPKENWNKVMRRPMSVSFQDGNAIRIIYKIVGPGTEDIGTWKLNDKVDIIGPLGNFWNNWNGYLPILMGGGVGIAPILNLHNHLKSLKVDHILIMGARNKSEHFLEPSNGNNIFITTDDGSLGIHGRITDALNEFDFNPSISKIFTCGPPLMMEAIRKLAIEKKVKCDLALERLMACGFGICQGCTVEKHESVNMESSYRSKFALACMDGPIFSAEEIVEC